MESHCDMKFYQYTGDYNFYEYALWYIIGTNNNRKSHILRHFCTNAQPCPTFTCKDYTETCFVI